MPRNDVKAYTSVIARIPQDLADQVKQYASQHRCTVSELIRDGLEMRLESGEVPGRSTGRSTDHGDEVLHKVLRVIPEVLQALSPMLLAQIQDTIRTTVTEVLHGMTEVLPFETPSAAPTVEGMTEVLQEVMPPIPSTDDEGVPAIIQTVTQPATEVLLGDTPYRSTGQASTPQPHAPSTERGHTSVLPQESTPTGQEEGHTEVLHTAGADGPAFDPQRYILGKLCARQHEWGTTGQSLLKKSNKGCPQCNTEQARERRARHKAAQAQEG